MNPKQLAFVNAYLGSAQGNATKAAVTAGYSERSAHVQGCMLLKDPKVRQAIEKRQERAIARAEMTADDIRREIEGIALAPVSDITPVHKLKALELLGKDKGLFQEAQRESRIQVNIGFLTSSDVSPRIIEVMPPQPRVAVISAPGDLCPPVSGEPRG